MCCVTSTSATARSRVACSTVKPSVQTSTTSPALAWPRCHSTIAQASIATVSTMVRAACSRRSRFEVVQAAAAGAHLAVDGAVEAAVLAADGAEGPDQRHVADDVGQLALDPRGLVGEAVMERRAAGGQPEQQKHDEGRRSPAAPVAIGRLTAAR